MTFAANAFGWPYFAQGYIGAHTPAPIVPGFGPGNGGEGWRILLNGNGATETATLAENLSSSSSLLTLTGDSGLPGTKAFVVTIDDEVMYVSRISSGLYRISRRGLSNTAAASHTAGADVDWTDSYEMGIESTENADAAFTEDATDFNGWLIAFDSTQAYLSTARYPMHVTELVGVFAADSGTTGTSKLDGPQPNAVCVPAGTSNDCPSAMSVPGRIDTAIVPGDVAVVRYTNPEATPLELGSRAVAIQSWYGLKRVNDDDTVDVTLTDPDGNIVDGTAEIAVLNPPGRLVTTTLPGDDRTFTYGPPRYSEMGWPIGAIAVRQGTRRVPFWESIDWHNFNFVYSGFATDATYVQVVINRNGFIWDDPVPSVDLPGPQDITGPNVIWDDGSFYFSTSWYVAISAHATIFVGPTLNGGGTGGGGVGGSGPGSGGGGTVGFDGEGEHEITPPDEAVLEGGSGGGIEAPGAGVGLYAVTDEHVLAFTNPNIETV